MTNEELETVKNYREQSITVAMLANKASRTLLYGYNVARETWHVYLKDGEIHTIKYRWDYQHDIMRDCVVVDVTNNQDLVPNKRLYPERCDFEFCCLLKQMGVNLPFTTFNSDIVVEPEAVFYGIVL